MFNYIIRCNMLFVNCFLKIQLKNIKTSKVTVNGK